MLILVPFRYHFSMNVSIKNLEAEVLARLAEQAAAEGLSQQEWIRRVLRRAAARLSPRELESKRAQLSPMTDEEFADLRQKVAARRWAVLEGLGAPRGRR